jgi:hypothetical protein
MQRENGDFSHSALDINVLSAPSASPQSGLRSLRYSPKKLRYFYLLNYTAHLIKAGNNIFQIPTFVAIEILKNDMVVLHYCHCWFIIH